MNKIKRIVKSKEQHGYIFIPNHEFYQATGINRKRWGMIYRDEVSPTIDELKAIAAYFEIDLTKLF